VFLPRNNAIHCHVVQDGGSGDDISQANLMPTQKPRNFLTLGCFFQSIVRDALLLNTVRKRTTTVTIDHIVSVTNLNPDVQQDGRLAIRLKGRPELRS